MAREDPTIYMRIPADLKSRLDEASVKNNRSLTAEVVSRLQASLESGDQGASEELQLKLSHLEGQAAGARAAFEFLAADTASRLSEGSSLLQTAVTLADYLSGAAEEMLTVALELFDGDVLDRKRIEWLLEGFQSSVNLSANELAELKKAQDDFLERPLPTEPHYIRKPAAPRGPVKSPNTRKRPTK